MKEPHPSEEDKGICKCLIAIAKDEKYQIITQKRDIIKNKLKERLNSEDFSLFLEYEATTNDLRDCIKNDTIENLQNRIIEEIVKYSKLI